MQTPQEATRPAATGAGRGASEIAALVTAGELSAAEVVDEHISRIEAVDGRLNAVPVRRFDEARAEARAVDEARARGDRLGPLAGVPTTVKEQFDVAGLATTFGLPSRSAVLATRDAFMVRRLREAGAIVLGKTNVPELLFYQEGDNPLFGRTNNPWNLERTTGGGSAGEGAILAAGGSALGLAADVGGSIRGPAHFCGVQGFRPTSKRLSILGSPPEFFFPGFETFDLDPGPMARHVADLALAMQVMAAPGQEHVDPRIPPVPWTDPAAVDVSRLRVAWFEDDGYWTPSPAIRRAVREAAEALRARGAQVEPWTPPGSGVAIRLYTSLLTADGVAWAGELLEGNPVDARIKMARQVIAVPARARRALGRVLRALGQRRLADGMLAVGRRSVREYRDLVRERDAWRADFLGSLQAGGYDAIVCPPHPLPAVRHGQSRDLSDTNNYSAIFNVLGLPAGAVAATRVRPGEESDRPRSRDVAERAARKAEDGSAGLPVGVQVSAPLWRDDVVLAVMGALEEHFRRQPDYPARPPL